MIESHPFFSIILPTYNRATFIEKAIDSVLKQTFKDFELIIIDDGSTDNTKQIVSSFNDKRIKYFYQINQEKSTARNNGIALANGKYICFIDSDDYYYNNHLEVFYNEIVLKNMPVSLFYTIPTWQDGDVISLEVIKKYNKYDYYNSVENRICEFLLFHSPLVQTSCIHSEILNKIKFKPNLKLTECYQLNGEVARLYDFININISTAVIVRHGKNSTTFDFNFLVNYEKEWNEIINTECFRFLKGNPLLKNKMSQIYLGLVPFFIKSSNTKSAGLYLLKALKTGVKNIYNRQFLGSLKMLIFR